jgi:hypothetical protein
MNQNIGAYLDALLWIGFGIVALFVAPGLIRKSPRGEQNAKHIAMLKICGIILLLVGCVRVASKLFGWGI